MTRYIEIADFLRPLNIDDSKLQRLAIELSRSYKHLCLYSTEQFLATPLNGLPSGHEQGRVLAMDLGGSNLRVGVVELLGNQDRKGSEVKKLHERVWSIGEHLKYDNSKDLFLWIGDCIAEVITSYLKDLGSHDALGDVVPMGVTFSFPMIQSSMSEAIIMPMGKGFTIASSSELNLGKLLQAGYSRHAQVQNMSPHIHAHPRTTLPHIEIVAITNDTVATMASLAYTHASTHPDAKGRVVAGLIVATGTNATTVIKQKDLHPAKTRFMKFPPKSVRLEEEADVVVNTEWTINGAAAPLRLLDLITSWDIELDRKTPLPGFQPFEYMSGGKYLGEIVRITIVDYLVKFQGVKILQLPDMLRQPYSITPLWLSKHVASSTSASDLCTRLTKTIPVPAESKWKWTKESANALIATANMVVTRSARMNAAAIVGLLGCAGELKIGEITANFQQGSSTSEYSELIVAFAGGVIAHYPGFLHEIQSAIDRLVSTLAAGRTVILREAKDGGIIGAGVLAGTVWNGPQPSLRIKAKL